jgi:hypothetical protein
MKNTSAPSLGGPVYRRYPAPLYYVIVAAVFGLCLWGWRRSRASATVTSRRSIADHGVADRPLTSGEFDALNFGPLVAGLSQFLRNRQTIGPLTLAVTGAWGSGKSSFMQLLRENLETASRPVFAGKLAVALAAMFAVFKTSQSFLQAFGVDPAKLLASVTDKARLSDLSAQTSFRHRFAQEFREVTAALQPRTMTVFIDDLDRCEPAQVMEVLKSLNFLASSGECFLIVGMEEKAVTNAVAASLHEQFEVQEGAKLEEAASLKKRWEYAQLWMEKFIQIRVAVPAATQSQYRSLLVGPRYDPELPPDSQGAVVGGKSDGSIKWRIVFGRHRLLRAALTRRWPRSSV